MDTDVQNLVTQVTNLKTIDASVLALINGIPALIAAAIANASSLSADDRAALEGAVTDITSQASALQAAVTANTPPAAPASPQTPAEQAAQP